MLQVVYLPLLSKLAVVVYATTRVVISQRLHRASTAHFDVGLTLAEYNAGIDQTQVFVAKRDPKKSSIPGLRFLTHRRSVLGCRRLHTDGVHLNNSGMRGFRRSTVFLTFQSLPTGPFQGHKMKISCVIGICMDVCVSMSVCVCKVMCLHVMCIYFAAGSAAK